MPKKEVADWKAALNEQAKRQAEESAGSGVKYISLAGGLMSIGDDLIPGNTLECIIVGSVIERTWYDRPYSPDDKGPPECFALASVTAELVPHANVAEPPCDKCRDCPKAEFGTALQGKGPACKTRRRLIVMPTPQEAGAVAEGELAVLKVPPTSVTNYTKYSQKLGRENFSHWAVSSLIKAAPHPKKQLEVTFAGGKPLGSDFLPMVYARLDEADRIAYQPFEYNED